jgi:hypothetical protein
MSIYHTVYRTTNNTNGKSYVGVHTTDNPNDDYLGSGLALRRAIKKYGASNFQKTIISYHDTREEAFQEEKRIVNEQWVNDPDSYNSMLGGMGGNFTQEIKNKISKSLTGKQQSEETKTKRASAHLGRKNSEETITKMRIAAKGRVITEKAKENMAKAYQNKPLMKCPHCNYSSRSNVIKRWHFENCRTLLSNA